MATEKNVLDGDKLKNSEFTGYWIPAHNAKMLEEGLEKGKSPLLPNKEGIIVCDPIYDLNTGYILSAKDLLPLQQKKLDNGYSSNVVGTTKTFRDAGTDKRENEQGFYYNFKQNDSFRIAQRLFPEQAIEPSKVIDYGSSIEHNSKKGKFKGINPIPQNNGKVVEVTNPKDFLAMYLAAQHSNVTLKVSPEVSQEFCNSFIAVCKNEHSKDKNKDISLHEFLFEAEVKKNDFIKAWNKDAHIERKKEKSMEVSRCF